MSVATGAVKGILSDAGDGTGSMAGRLSCWLVLLILLLYRGAARGPFGLDSLSLD